MKKVLDILKLNKLFCRDRLATYNQRSLVWEDDERIVYLFDYSKGNSGRGEVVNRHVLRKLVSHHNIIWINIFYCQIANCSNGKCFYSLYCWITPCFLHRMK